MIYNDVSGLVKAKVIVDDKYLKLHCGIYKNSIVYIKSTNYWQDGSLRSYQIIRPDATGELTFHSHELELLTP